MLKESELQMNSPASSSTPRALTTVRPVLFALMLAAGCEGYLLGPDQDDARARGGDMLTIPARDGLVFPGEDLAGPAKDALIFPGKDLASPAKDGKVKPPPKPDGPAPKPDKAVVVKKCGNGKCEPGESCSSCPGDCGKCVPCHPGCPGGYFCYLNKCVKKAISTAPVKDLFLSEADKLYKCPFNPMHWWAGKGDRDITFIATTDTHATDSASGCSKNGSHTGDEHTKLRAALNSANAKPHVWPSGANFWRQGKAYDHIRGVLIAGDLTDAGSDPNPAGTQLGHDCREYTAYRAAYGRCGNEGKVKFPIYEAYGNHDFPRVSGSGDAKYHPVISYLDAITAAHRPGSSKDLYDDPTPGTGHYAWRWDDVWFVNLNLKAGNKKEVIPGSTGTRLAYPHSPLDFLTKFLKARSKNKSRQIVILAHYSPTSSRVSSSERSDFCKLIYQAQYGKGPFSSERLSKNYPVAAFLHGHDHHLPEYKLWTCPSPYSSIKIPRFSVGNPLYKGSKHPGKLNFTIIRLGEKRLEAVGVKASASNPTGSWSYVYKKMMYVVNK